MMRMIEQLTKEFYVKQMLSIKITIQIHPILEVVVPGNGRKFFHQFGRKYETKKTTKEKLDLD